MALFQTNQQWQEVKSRGFLNYMISKIKLMAIFTLGWIVIKQVLPHFRDHKPISAEDIVLYIIFWVICSVIFGVVVGLIGWAVNDSRVN
jgi:Na+/proline symporter